MASSLKNLRKKIAENIICAQAASDGGKGIDEISDLLGEKTQKACWSGYDCKDYYIFAAICLINKLPDNSFRYSVAWDRGTGRHGSYIVYFSAKLPQGRVQVSFHCFNSGLEKFFRSGKNHVTHWDQKGSRAACVEMKKAYFG